MNKILKSLRHLYIHICSALIYFDSLTVGLSLNILPQGNKLEREKNKNKLRTFYLESFLLKIKVNNF